MKVTMDTTGGVGEKFSAQTQTFIEVIKSDIVVQLFANTVFKQTVGSNSVLTISPRDNSYDPDVDRAVMPDVRWVICTHLLKTQHIDCLLCY
ncbi:hypothetical protein DPMN_032849 [Dreissena polymorpha]|uniref:Uncharacterized protein n=1 Tax=Dreissena polymorpha TaxID=45954 RepID=A0A9D4M5I6_DREPO|nr:hypothetical protein DPMN_032849 [Dreissena polymorpha]